LWSAAAAVLTQQQQQMLFLRIWDLSQIFPSIYLDIGIFLFFCSQKFCFFLAPKNFCWSPK
jgi:hypothetical protein